MRSPLQVLQASARPARAIYRPGFAVDLTFQSLPFNVPWQADLPGASSSKYFQCFLIRLKLLVFFTLPLILRRKSTGWAVRTVLLDVTLLCEVAFPNAVQPFLELNINSPCPFLARGAEQTRAAIMQMLCRIRDGPSMA